MTEPIDEKDARGRHRWWWPFVSRHRHQWDYARRGIGGWGVVRCLTCGKVDIY